MTKKYKPRTYKRKYKNKPAYKRKRRISVKRKPLKKFVKKVINSLSETKSANIII